ncbi:MAG: hypothetical protein AAB668_02385 [Patescibacteria group bacterium]
MKNRKVSRPAPVRPALPKNVRVASKRAAAFNRFAFWFTVTMFAGCAATALLYVRLFLTNTLRFESAVLLAVSMSLIAAVGLVEAILAWSDMCAATEKLGRRHKALATRRSTSLH